MFIQAHHILTAFIPLLLLQAEIPLPTVLDSVTNLSIAAALLVAVGKGWVVPGPIHTAERERTERLDVQLENATEQNHKLLEVTESILSLVRIADERDKWRPPQQEGKARNHQEPVQ